MAEFRNLGGKRRVWSQVVFEFLLSGSHITKDEYDRYSAFLLASGYKFTRMNSDTLMSYFRLANWRISLGQTESALAQFSDQNISSDTLVRVGSEFLVHLFREPLTNETRGLIADRIISGLGKRDDGRQCLVQMRATLIGSFGLNLIGRANCLKILDSWLR